MILTVWLTWDLYESKEMQREIEYDDIIQDSIRKEPKLQLPSDKKLLKQDRQQKRPYIMLFATALFSSICYPYILSYVGISIQ